MLFLLFGCAASSAPQPSQPLPATTPSSQAQHSPPPSATSPAPQISPQYTTALFPDNVSISLEIASSPSQIADGLSNRSPLCGTCGMLFIFPDSAPRSFWMKGMLFPLDILFLDENFTILNMAENVQPCIEGSACPAHPSQGNAKYVLEANAGFAEAHGARKGSVLAVN